MTEDGAVTSASTRIQEIRDAWANDATCEECQGQEDVQDLLAEIQRLQAELAQARAERDSLAEKIAATESEYERLRAGWIAERDASLAVVKVVRQHAAPQIKHLLPISWHPLCDALAAFDKARHE